MFSGPSKILPSKIILVIQFCTRPDNFLWILYRNYMGLKCWSGIFQFWSQKEGSPRYMQQKWPKMLKLQSDIFTGKYFSCKGKIKKSKSNILSGIIVILHSPFFLDSTLKMAGRVLFWKLGKKRRNDPSCDLEMTLKSKFFAAKLIR